PQISVAGAVFASNPVRQHMRPSAVVPNGAVRFDPTWGDNHAETMYHAMAHGPDAGRRRFGYFAPGGGEGAGSPASAIPASSRNTTAAPAGSRSRSRREGWRWP